MRKYWFNSIFFNNQLLCGHRNRISKAVDSLIRTIGNTSGGEYPVLNDTDKKIHSRNNHNQSCIDGYLCSEISSDGDSDSGKSINDNDIDNDSDEILKGGVYYLNRTYLHTEDYTDYIDKNGDESLGSVDNDSNICNDEIVNGSDSDSLNGSQDFRHLWVLCDECYISNYKKNLKSRLNICEYCGFHLKMNSSDRIELLVDSGTWEPMDEDLISVDPIEFDKEEVKGLDMSEWLKEFKELFEMLDEIEEKVGEEKMEAAKRLKEWEGWETWKEKEEEKEEKEVEGWKKEWNDWEDWRRQQEGRDKARERLLDCVEDCLKTKKTKECKGMRQQETLEEEKERERQEKLRKELKEFVKPERLRLRKRLSGWELRERLSNWKELSALFQKIYSLNFEWWKKAEEALDLLEEGAELEEFKELFEKLKEFKKSLKWLKETAEEVEEVEEETAEEVEEAEEVKEPKEAEEAEEAEEAVEEVEEVKEQSYLDRIDSHQRKTGLSEAVQTGIGRINGFPVAMGFMDFEFIGGSMGSVVGEKIARLIEYATKNSMPLIMVCASGGARMQEGTLSLMQMAKISSLLNTYQLKRKLFYVSILTTPTTGGVTASFGMLGDIIIAEPNAHIAFAGPRIIEQLLNVTVPEGLQEAENSFEKGLLDLIIPRNPLKGVLSELFQLHGFFSWSFR